jgi:hypothetical protein
MKAMQTPVRHKAVDAGVLVGNGETAAEPTQNVQVLS